MMLWSVTQTNYLMKKKHRCCCFHTQQFWLFWPSIKPCN